MSTFFPGDDDKDPQIAGGEQTPPAKTEAIDDVVTSDDDPDRDVAPVPDPKRNTA